MSPSNLSSIAKLSLLSSAIKSQHRIAHRCVVPLSNARKMPVVNHGACGDRPAVTRKKKRFQVVARNRMTSASGFTWFAREPKLICGAEGRASSQRSIDYHSRFLLRQHKNCAQPVRFAAEPGGSCPPPVHLPDY